MKNNLSICIITYNDERYIADSLSELKDIADEIIVVDLGSKDKTAKVAEQAGAVVYRTDFQGDFSAIRNFCMEQSGGRWVLLLRANETIPEPQRGQIPRLLDNPNVEGYLLYVDYPAMGYGVFSPVQMLRLVRNRGEYRFCCRSFEKVPDEVLSNIEDADIQVAYREGAQGASDFSIRLALLCEELQQCPKDCYLQYMYGIMLLNQGQYEQAALFLQLAYTSANPEFLYTPHLYKCYGWALLFLGQNAEAEAVFSAGMERYPFYTDYYVLRAEIYRQSRKYTEAVSDLETGLTLFERPHFLVPGPEIAAPVIHETLGAIYEEAFCLREAAGQYLQAYALQAEGESDALLYKIGALSVIEDPDGECARVQDASVRGEYFTLMRQGREEEAKKILPRLLAETTEEYYPALAKPWAKSGCVFVMQELERGITDDAAKEEFWRSMAGYLLYCNQFEAAGQIHVNLPEEMECALWCERRMGGLTQKTGIKKKARPALIRFYRSFCKESAAKTSPAAIHAKIGDAYEAAGKKSMAMYAWLRSLQTDPAYAYALQKRLEFYRTGAGDFQALPENCVFQSKQDLQSFLAAADAFWNRQYKQATDLFAKVSGCPDLVRTYAAACGYLAGEETEVPRESAALFTRICKNGILIRLSDTLCRCPGSGLLLRIKKELEE